MANENLMLYVASYDDADAAGADFEALKDAQGAEDFARGRRGRRQPRRRRRGHR